MASIGTILGVIVVWIIFSALVALGLSIYEYRKLPEMSSEKADVVNAIKLFMYASTIVSIFMLALFMNNGYKPFV